MSTRVDSASRLISATPTQLFSAFSEPGAMERWLPPKGMSAEMVHFDFRDGGSYRMRLLYSEAQQGHGKTSEDMDEVDVRIVRLERNREIVQDITFSSDDPAYSGLMRMTWIFEAEGAGTRVSIRAENVPEGIRPEDHQAGLDSSLENLAAFVE